jgi:hypothetical protein
MKKILIVVLALALYRPAMGATLLTITTSKLPVGTAGRAYPTIQLKATGGRPPYRWSLPSGRYMPNGLKLSSVGVISGKLNLATCTTAVKCYKRIIVIVTDSTGAAAQIEIGEEE